MEAEVKRAWKWCEAQELKALRNEKARLNNLVANLSVDKDASQEVIAKERLQLVGTKAQFKQARADVEEVRSK